MTTTANLPALPKTQVKALFTVLPMMVLADGGEISEYAARTSGAGIAALNGLVDKGILVRRAGEFEMPVGPYAGEILTHPFYSVP